MRSTTCWLNSTLYHKTMSRFWPVWAGYGLLLAFLLPLNLLQQFRYADQDPYLMLNAAVNLPQMIGSFVLILVVGGVLVAMGMFGYLYNNRAACMMHALPLRRETLFTTQYLAGLSILCLPVLAMAVLATFVEMAFLPHENWALALFSLWMWVLSILVISLFFFSLACFCAMFTGHILALPVFYGVANVAVAALYALFLELARRFLYGFSATNPTPMLIEFLTPVFSLAKAVQWNVTYEQLPNSFNHSHTANLPIAAQLNSPTTLVIYAVAALVLAGIALILYKNRRIESAGDVVAIPAIRPLFKIGVSLAVGLIFGMLTSVFFSVDRKALPLSLFILVWAVGGWFIASMFLEKSFRVWKYWKGALGMAAVLALVAGSLTFDWFGYERRVPHSEDVASITVGLNLGAPEDSAHYVNLDSSDPQLIQAILNLHQTVVDNRKQYQENSVGNGSLGVVYHLKNGRHITRSYTTLPIVPEDLKQEGSLTWQYQQLIQNRTLVKQAYNFDFYEQGKLNSVEVQGALISDSNKLTTYIAEDLSGQQRLNLWNAVRQDFEEGTIGVRYLFDDKTRWENTYITDLSFQWEMINKKNGSPYPDALKITLTPHASHTLALLKEYGVFDGTYTLAPHSNNGDTGPDSEPYLDDLENTNINSVW